MGILEELIYNKQANIERETNVLIIVIVEVNVVFILPPIPHSVITSCSLSQHPFYPSIINKSKYPGTRVA